MENKNVKIPLLIIIYAIVVILGNIVATYVYFSDPGLIYRNVDGAGSIDEDSPVIRYLVAFFASRSIATIAVLLMGIIHRNPKVLVAMFIFGFIANTMDLLVLSNIYISGMAMIHLVRWSVFGLLQLIAAIVLIKRYRRSDQIN